MGLQEDLSLSSGQFYNAVMIFCMSALPTDRHNVIPGADESQTQDTL